MQVRRKAGISIEKTEETSGGVRFLVLFSCLSPFRTRPRYQFVLPVLSGIFFQFGGGDFPHGKESSVSSIKLGGGFKYFLFSSLPGEMIQFD